MGKNLYICLEYICCIYPRNGYSLLSTSNDLIAGRETSPLPPPRGINSVHGSTSSLTSNSNINSTTTATARSEFFIPITTEQQPTQRHQQQHHKNHHNPHHHHQPHNHHQHHHHQNNLHSANKLPSNNTVFNDFQNHNNSLNFNEIHEQFRQLVMKDILEYQAQREIKARPLIQL